MIDIFTSFPFPLGFIESIGLEANADRAGNRTLHTIAKIIFFMSCSIVYSIACMQRKM